MHTKETSLTFTGHRNEKLPKTLEGMEKLKSKLWNEVDKAIADGIDTFYFGGCRGFDLLCADIVEKRKRVIKPTDPKLSCTVLSGGKSGDYIKGLFGIAVNFSLLPPTT